MRKVEKAMEELGEEESMVNETRSGEESVNLVKMVYGFMLM